MHHTNSSILKHKKYSLDLAAQMHENYWSHCSNLLSKCGSWEKISCTLIWAKPFFVASCKLDMHNIWNWNIGDTFGGDALSTSLLEFSLILCFNSYLGKSINHPNSMTWLDSLEWFELPWHCSFHILNSGDWSNIEHSQLMINIFFKNSNSELALQRIWKQIRHSKILWDMLFPKNASREH